MSNDTNNCTETMIAGKTNTNIPNNTNVCR